MTLRRELGRAAVLGAIQGPSELLPISSSAHIGIATRLAGWQGLHADPSERKAFEVALHAGAAAALAIGGRAALADAIRSMSRRRLAVTILATAPPALAGLAGQQLIEERLSGGSVTAAGLAAGAIGMLLADTAPEQRGPGDARPVDGLLLGAAQAAALVPGISRNGATLTVARARRFTRAQAARLSWGVALPIVSGALLLKGPALAGGLRDPRRRPVLLAGMASAAGSTAISVRLLGAPVRPRRLWPFALYRLALAGFTAR